MDYSSRCAWNAFWLTLCYTTAVICLVKEQSTEERQSSKLSDIVTKIQCKHTDGKIEHSVCKISNLVLFNGQAYIVSSKLKELPPIILDFENNTLETILVRPDALPFNWNDVEVAVVNEAYMLHHLFLGNFYHDFAETAPTIHMSLCAHWNRCSLATPVSLLTLHGLDLDIDVTTAKHLQQVVKCFGGMSVQAVKSNAFKRKVYVVNTAFTGIGQHVRAFHNYNEALRANYNLSMPKEQALSWRRRLAECLGKDFVSKKVPCPSLPLHITIVNRPYHKGRSLLNHVEIEQLIRGWDDAKQLWPGGIKVTHVYTDGLGLKEQAFVFWNSHIVIWPHGAAMSNLLFLPQGAAALEIIPWPGADERALWASTLKEHLHLDIHYDYVMQQHPQNVIPHMDYFQRTPEFTSQSDAARLAFYENVACPEGVGFTCILPWRHWRTSFVMDWAHLAGKLRTSIAAVHTYAKERMSDKC